MRWGILSCFLILFRSGFSQEYFQQEVNYTISVSLDDVNHFLNAYEEFEYINNSPDVLDTLWLHIWPNAYKDNSTALASQFLDDGSTYFYFSDEQYKGYIDSLNFKVDDQTVIWNYDEQHPDICYLVLNAPLESGNKLTVSTPFRVKIPHGSFSRLGHIGESYMITQWYPKPAVYDRDGWHAMPYLNQGEFYSEYGSFDVSITLPGNYKLAATGDRQNAIQEEYELQELATKTANTVFDSTYFADEGTMAFPLSSQSNKTIRFYQKNVHDFAWFADKRWHALNGSVTLPHSGNVVQLWTFFTDAEADLWANSIEYMHDAVYYYSLWNGDYPYNHCTAVDGTISAGGGMEYPNITVIGSSGDSLSLETVIMHEVGHNWFYGLLGSNERDHAWMDEGINSFNELRYTRTKYPEVNMIGAYFGVGEDLLELANLNNKDPKFLYEAAYLLNARRGYDQPNDLHSDEFTSINYATMVYMKTAVAFDYLFNYLGDSLFDACAQAYFDRWHFKHPQPQDIEDVYEEVSGKELDWFFKDVLTTTGKVDYKIKSAYINDPKGTGELSNTPMIRLKNNGDILSPVLLTTVKNDSVYVQHWLDGFEGATTRSFIFESGDEVWINPPGKTLDAYTTNNYARTKGLFKKWEWPRIKFLGGWEEDDRATIYWSPILGWNKYNSMMLGLAVYSSLVPQQKFEYAWAPMISFKADGALTGSGFLAYNWFPQKSFQYLRASYNWSNYDISDPDNGLGRSWYTKGELRLDTHIKDKHLADNKDHYVSLWGTGISEYWYYDAYYLESSVGVDLSGFDQYFAGLSYTYKNDFVLRPHSVKAEFEYGYTGTFFFFDPLGMPTSPGTADFAKVSAEFNYGILYNAHRKKIDFRIFGGYFLFNNTVSSRYNWQMDGQNGPTDYRYNEIFLGRNQINPDVLAQQQIFNHGGFKTPMLSGHSNNWLFALNVDADLPFPPPLSVFADLGMYPFLINGEPSSGTLYDAGISLKLLGGNFRINLPLFFSEDISQEYETRDIGFAERITFNLRLKAFNPLKLVRELPY